MIESGDLKSKIEQKFTNLYTALVIQEGTISKVRERNFFWRIWRAVASLMPRQVQGITGVMQEDLRSTLSMYSKE